MRVILGQIVCICWKPEFFANHLPALIFSNDLATADAGVHILIATLEQLQSCSQSTSVSLSGKILSSEIPVMKERLGYAQRDSVRILTDLLGRILQSHGQLPENFLKTTLEAIRTLFPYMQDHALNSFLWEEPVLSELCINLTRASSLGGGIATMSRYCLEELITRPMVPMYQARMYTQVLESLKTICPYWQQHQAMNSPEDIEGFAGFTRLFVSTLQRALLIKEKSPELSASINAALEALTHLATTAKSPMIVLSACEAWHAVLTYMEELEALQWGSEEAIDDELVSATKDKAFYKQGILHMVNLLVGIFFSSIFEQPIVPLNPPFLIEHVDYRPSSGTVLEDWVLTVGRESLEEENTAAATVDEDGEDSLALSHVMGANASTCGYSPPGSAEDNNNPSEAAIFAQQAEYYIAHAVSSYSKELLGRMLPLFTRSIQLTLEEPSPEKFLKVDFSIRLLSRAAPYFPTKRLLSNDNITTNPQDVRDVGPMVMDVVEQVVLTVGRRWLTQFEPQTPTDDYRMNSLAGLFKFLSPVVSVWISQILLQTDLGAEVEQKITHLIVQIVDLIAYGITTIPRMLTVSGFEAVGKNVVLSAVQAFLSLTSVTLSSSTRLKTQILRAVIGSNGYTICNDALGAALATPREGYNSSPLLPDGVLRLLSVSLSDLALRSWGHAIQTNAVQVEERIGAFATVISPILKQMQDSTAAVNAGHLLTPAMVHQLTLVTILGKDIVNSYTGTSKTVRVASYTTLVVPGIASAVPIINALRSQAQYYNSIPRNAKLATTLLNFISSCLQTYPAELGTEYIEELLKILVSAFSSTASALPAASDSAFEADLLVLSIIKTSLGQGRHKHSQLVEPAMNFALQVLERANEVVHMKSEVLTILLNIMQNHARFLNLHSDQSPAPGCIVVFNSLATFLQESAEMRIVPSANDIKLILEELFDLRSAIHLYSKPYFLNFRISLMDSILMMLLSRMYRGCQDYMLDTLYGLASTNYTEFTLNFLPEFTQRRLGALGSKAHDVVSLLGVGDMNPTEFDRAVLTFVNDAVFYEKLKPL